MFINNESENFLPTLTLSKHLLVILVWMLSLFFKEIPADGIISETNGMSPAKLDYLILDIGTFKLQASAILVAMALEKTALQLLAACMYFCTIPSSFPGKSGLSCCNFFGMQGAMVRLFVQLRKFIFVIFQNIQTLLFFKSY